MNKNTMNVMNDIVKNAKVKIRRQTEEELEYNFDKIYDTLEAMRVKSARVSIDASCEYADKIIENSVETLDLIVPEELIGNDRIMYICDLLEERYNDRKAISKEYRKKLMTPSDKLWKKYKKQSKRLRKQMKARRLQVDNTNTEITNMNDQICEISDRADRIIESSMKDIDCQDENHVHVRVSKPNRRIRVLSVICRRGIKKVSGPCKKVNYIVNKATLGMAKPVVMVAALTIAVSAVLVVGTVVIVVENIRSIFSKSKKSDTVA